MTYKVIYDLDPERAKDIIHKVCCNGNVYYKLRSPEPISLKLNGNTLTTEATKEELRQVFDHLEELLEGPSGPYRVGDRVLVWKDNTKKGELKGIIKYIDEDDDDDDKDPYPYKVEYDDGGSNFFSESKKINRTCSGHYKDYIIRKLEKGE